MTKKELTQERYIQIKELLQGPFAIRSFYMVGGVLKMKEESASTLAMAIVIDFEKEGKPNGSNREKDK